MDHFFMNEEQLSDQKNKQQKQTNMLIIIFRAQMGLDMGSLCNPGLLSGLFS